MADFSFQSAVQGEAHVVLDLFTDEAFLEDYAGRLHALSYEVDVAQVDGRREVRLVVEAPTKGAPSIATKLVGPSIPIRMALDWTPTPVGAVGPLSIDARAKGELRFRAQARVVGEGPVSLLEVEGPAPTVSVPLVGGALAGLVSQLLHGVLRTKVSLADEWLAAGYPRRG
ncbi:MAG: DUF2505 domain-containing protein [Motilibacteraceae bacterium]